MTIVLASGGTLLPVVVGAAIVGIGVGLCLDAVGATESSDMLNPYYWAQAAPTIVESAIIPLQGLRSVVKGTKLLNKLGVPILEQGNYALKASVNRNKFESIQKVCGEEIKGFEYSKSVDYLYGFFGLEIPSKGD